MGEVMEQYLIYLRKSRKDRELESQTGQFDTLQRHRDTLTTLAQARGYPIAHIYEEVVSGDTIADRPEMQKLLSAVETGAFSGVLVMEVPRLARGNTRDQGMVAETFQYSGTKIITPEKVYDPADEADEEYFEFGLFMSRREYKAINRRLQRGRLASLNEGKFVAGTAPYGYHKVRLSGQKGYTLAIEPDQAEVVREIFQLYACGDAVGGAPLSSGDIAQWLNARAIPSPGGVKWSAPSVRDILKNPTYAGYLRWGHRPDKKQMVDGSVVLTRPVNPEGLQRKGLHPAIVSQSLWSAARSAMESRAHAPVPGPRRLSNPLAGLVYCSLCGKPLVQLPQGSHGAPMLVCPTKNCPTVGSRRDVVESAILQSLQSYLKDCRISMAAGAEHSASAIRESEHQLSKVQRSLEVLAMQRERLHDLVEQGVYTQEVFLERSRSLNHRIADASSREQALRLQLCALRQPEAARRPMESQSILQVYSSLETAGEKNTLLKAAVDHVVYWKSVGGQWRKSDLKLYIYPKLRDTDQGL